MDKQTHSIRLTETALAVAERMLQENEQYSGLSLRVYLEGKGCDGFFYGVAFDPPAASDISEQQGQLSIICDPESIVFLKGAQIDWVDDDRGQGFLVENPQHRKFRGKFYKRKAWQDFLESRSVSESTVPAE